MQHHGEHSWSLIEDSVDGGLAQPGLLSDLADLVTVRHRCPDSVLKDANVPRHAADMGLLRLVAHSA